MPGNTIKIGSSNHFHIARMHIHVKMNWIGKIQTYSIESNCYESLKKRLTSI